MVRSKDHSFILFVFIFFLCTWISNFPSTICWKYKSFSTELFLYFCWKSMDHTCVGLFLDSIFCLLYLSILKPISHCLDDYSFMICKLDTVSPPNWFLVFKIVLAILGLLLWIIKSVCQLYKNNLLEFWLGSHQIYK